MDVFYVFVYILLYEFIVFCVYLEIFIMVFEGFLYVEFFVLFVVVVGGFIFEEVDVELFLLLEVKFWCLFGFYLNYGNCELE